MKATNNMLKIFHRTIAEFAGADENAFVRVLPGQRADEVLNLEFLAALGIHRPVLDHGFNEQKPVPGLMMDAPFPAVKKQFPISRNPNPFNTTQIKLKEFSYAI